MHQALVVVACSGANALAMKAREQRSGASSVETFVVIEDANPQNQRTFPGGEGEKNKNRN
jgi:hypothetical protein